jgi:hypothetical protein
LRYEGFLQAHNIHPRKKKTIRQMQDVIHACLPHLLPQGVLLYMELYMHMKLAFAEEDP